MTPRTNGDLVIAVGNTQASVAGPTGGFTSLTMNSSQGDVAAYNILSGSVVPAMHWAFPVATTWNTIEAAFVPGPSTLNPDLQFPETLVQISSQGNYLAPIQGTGIWTDVSLYFKGGTLGPLGRQHELDRVQSTQTTLTMNNRDGTWNPWNSNSFLWNGGMGLSPMNPVKVTAAWQGITNSEFYGYVQEILPVIGDVLNVDATVTCYDIFQMLSLKYLSNNNYAALVLADGGAGLTAYYRLGDEIGSNAVLDSSGNNATGSLIGGIGGEPAFGTPSGFLFDSNTALDLTNGTNAPNGGFQTVDNTTQPPTQHDPLGFTGTFSTECWFRYTDPTVYPGDAPNGDLFSGLRFGTQWYPFSWVPQLV